MQSIRVFIHAPVGTRGALACKVSATLWLAKRDLIQSGFYVVTLLA